MISIAILMTCHNRRDLTLECLDAIENQQHLEDHLIDIYLVDDGSTDGTGDAVRSIHPNVKVIQGDGQLYWCGGMRKAWLEASCKRYDFFLWLNDDTFLYPEAISRLLTSYESLSMHENQPILLAGATCDSESGECTFGGAALNGFLTRPAFVRIDPSSHPVKCDTLNGNCVLVSRQVFERAGYLSEHFTHGLGDYDFGLRAKKLGIQSWLLDGFIGECDDDKSGNWQDESMPVDDRILAMKRPTGLPPVREWMIFTWRHAGWAWPVCWLRSIGRMVFPELRLKVD